MKTFVMGILNTTPDSFYDGGRYSTLDKALDRAEKMIQNGGDLIDVGGESTRPGSAPVELEEELNRVIPVINEISKRFNVPVSVDTYKSQVARRALNCGATIVNDISGLRFDPEMVRLVVEKNVDVVIMHMQGTPKNMQVEPHYDDVVEEIKTFFQERIKFAVQSGVKKEKIILDPGIGFGKTTEHNLEILRRLNEFKPLGHRLLLGTSRKSFIGRILGTESSPVPAEERLEGSLVTYVWAMLNGVNILRVHDVKETKKVIKFIEGTDLK